MPKSIAVGSGESVIEVERSRLYQIAQSASLFVASQRFQTGICIVIMQFIPGSFVSLFTYSSGREMTFVSWYPGFVHPLEKFLRKAYLIIPLVAANFFNKIGQNECPISYIYTLGTWTKSVLLETSHSRECGVRLEVVVPLALNWNSQLCECHIGLMDHRSVTSFNTGRSIFHAKQALSAKTLLRLLIQLLSLLRDMMHLECDQYLGVKVSIVPPRTETQRR